MSILDNVFKRKRRPWKRNEKNTLKEFSWIDVSSHDVCMLLWHLHKKYDFHHITYIAECNRVYLCYISDYVPEHIRIWFNDRSPHEIEKLCRKCGKKYMNIKTVNPVYYADGFLSPEVFFWREMTKDECKEKESGGAYV